MSRLARVPSSEVSLYGKMSGLLKVMQMLTFLKNSNKPLPDKNKIIMNIYITRVLEMKIPSFVSLNFSDQFVKYGIVNVWPGFRSVRLRVS